MEPSVLKPWELLTDLTSVLDAAYGKELIENLDENTAFTNDRMALQSSQNYRDPHERILFSTSTESLIQRLGYSEDRPGVIKKVTYRKVFPHRGSPMESIFMSLIYRSQGEIWWASSYILEDLTDMDIKDHSLTLATETKKNDIM